MKTTKTLKERREIINRVLLNSINSDDVILETDKQKIEYAFNRFKSEYGYNVNRIGLYKSVSEWLSGLALDLPFMYVDILKLAEELGYATLTEKQEDKILNNYWDYMSNAFLQLCRKHKINIYEVI